jgi:para-aminobenzoate synthetase component I
VKPGVHAHLVEEIELALPLDRYRDAFPSGRGGMVLDGGDFAMLGAEPFLAFRAFRSGHRLASGALGASVVIEERGVTVRAEVDDPLETVRALLREHAVDPALFTSRPLPLLAGAVGYVGYETGQMLERLPSLERPSLDLPDIALFFHDWILGTNRRTNRSYLSVLSRADTMEEAKATAAKTRDRLISRLRSFEAIAPPLPVAGCLTRVPCFSSLLSSARATPLTPRDAYLSNIRTAKNHILEGNAFEICLTHRLDAPFSGDPFTLWRHLRRESPSPFAAFLDLPEAAIVSSSPERFLSLSTTRIAESRPIKGTRPRGVTPDEDARLAAELQGSPKDRAENAMIVDLVRNDLGRVCRFGTVEATDLFVVEHYSTVHQLVSTVRGELDEEHDAIDLLRACFPPGSMTGAPKIEAMSILEALEPTERGVYSGALGWFDFAGSLDLSVVIRTIVVKDGYAHLHVGGAIVSDSEESSEHDETMHKARAMLAALGSVALEHEAGTPS